MASLQSRLQDLAVRFGTQSKLLLTLINGNVSTLSALKTTAKSNLVAAINEVYDRGSAAGTGDMLKSTYDTNNDGIVDRAASADSVQWGNVQNKPSSFTPSAHDASLITSGTIDRARLPNTLGRAPIVSSGGIADFTEAQQNAIGEGSTVTTMDGRSWQYTGTGNKLLEANYVEMADKTPEWSVIANKPTTVAGYSITDVWTKSAIGDPDVDLVAIYEQALA